MTDKHRFIRFKQYEEEKNIFVLFEPFSIQ